jgi:hypothetical protein
MRSQGWYRDPYRTHDERWFSNGQPTNLVRDHGTESYDEPPQDQVRRDWLPADPPVRPAGGQLPPGEWRSWTVWVPGLLTLVPLCYVFYLGGWIGRIGVWPVIALLVAGLRKPEWRPVIAVPLWAAFALSCWIWAVLQSLRSFT